ncbi:MAG: MFS transporter [Actinophytocola sp.]|uniref:MFS transporter n=1 Tax=Actinophytocola sp. TaxID=1872138 RepID=UPI0013281040|nr:MFS transporter [Actinophytocola sp.]MPZ85124.1 MFS transporter [Actinophytocola sp.]
MTEATDPAADRATFRQVLAEPIFRVLFWTRALAVGADTLRTVALSVLVYTATGSAFLGALTFGISFLPQVVGGVVIGALPDLVRPRVLIVTGYSLEAAGAATLALVDLPVWASLLLVAAIGCLAPVFNGTAGKLTADSLTGDAFVLGRSLFQLAASAAQVLGLAAGGIAIATVGARQGLLITAACHLVAALGARLLLPNLPAPGRTAAQSLVGRSWRVNRELLADRTVRRLLLAMWLPPAFVTGADSLLVPFAAQRGFPNGSAGYLLACVPVGMLIGNLVVARLLAPDTRERMVPVLVVVLGVPLLGFAFPLGVVPLGVLLAVAGIGFGYGLGVQRPYRDAIPHESRGQAFGLMSTGLMTLQGVGPALFGFATEAVPVGVTMALGGVATVLVAIWIRASGTVPGPKSERLSQNENAGSRSTADSR